MNKNLRSVIRKLVDAESFNSPTEHYRTVVKVVEYRLDEYLKFKTGADRLAWLKQIVFDVCHRGLSYTNQNAQRKSVAMQLKQSKQLLRVLKQFIK